MVELTNEQKSILKELLYLIHVNSFENDMFVSTVGGYAGTGKTTLICELRKQLHKIINIPVAFLTFTGKASSVLKSKLIANNALYGDDYIGTIHGLIYKPETIWDKKLKTFVITGWTLRSTDEIWPQLFIIDEASMISKTIWEDLLKFHKSIIAVGDHGQLPPIGDNFSLLINTDFTLNEIHRQALNSPIIALSKFIREQGFVPKKIFSPEVFKLSWKHPWCKKIWDEKVNFDNDEIILCGFNTTRANLNDMIRKKLGYKEKAPYPGEKVVCLLNNHNKGIMNGQIGTIMWLMPEFKGVYRITLELDGEIYEVLSADKCFGEVQYTMYYKSPEFKKLIEEAFDRGFKSIDFFDYGYVISVHKSQGAEWNKVIVFEQRSQHWDDEYYTRWLYTAVTRARKKLMIIDDAWI